jgi:hypothetical protein
MLKREKYLFCLVMDSFYFLSGGIGVNANKGNWELQGLRFPTVEKWCSHFSVYLGIII